MLSGSVQHLPAAMEIEEKQIFAPGRSRKCVILGVLSAGLVAASVGVLVYFLAPCQQCAAFNCPSAPPSGRPSSSRLPAPPPPTRRLKLPRAWSPTHYRLTLHPDIYLPDPDLFNYNGVVNISLESVVSSNVITLHFKELTIKRSAIRVHLHRNGSTRPVRVSHVTTDTKRDFYHIRLRQKIGARSHVTVYLEFQGDIRRNMKGIYWSDYTEGNETRYMLISDLEPVDARRILPCLDEPQLKAVFIVSLGHLPTWTALSNAPASHTTNSTVRPGWVVTHFLPTPRMSTYLLAVSVNRYGHVSTTVTRPATMGVNASSTQVRHWTRHQYIDAGWVNDSLQIAANALSLLETTFNFTYPIAKEDQVTVQDFSAGAMENWGLVTYLERGLVWEPQHSDSWEYEWLNSVIVHELTHQWLGNLVTCRWWSHLWLQEGMASFYEFPIMQQIRPKWDQDQLFVYYTMRRAFVSDSVPAHALYHPPNKLETETEIRSMFSSITYDKGASLIRMTQRDILGEDSYAAAMKSYIRQHAYGSADYTDLLSAWVQQAAISNVSVPADMDLQGALRSWVVQSGYPLVTVSLVGGDTYRLTQAPFRLHGPDPSKPSPTWDVPVSYVWQASTQRSVIWLGQTIPHVDISRPTQLSNWVLLNHKQRGFYRVNYCPQLWDLLITQLNLDPSRIDVVNRGQLIQDSMALASAGYINYTVPLRVAEHLLRWPGEFVELSALWNALRFMENTMVNDFTYSVFEKHVADLVNLSFESIPANLRSPGNDDIIATYGHIMSARIACQFGHVGCVSWAVRLFDRWMQQPDNFSIIPPNYRRTVYCTAVQHDTTGAAWRFLYNITRDFTHFSREKRHRLRALGCTRDPAILRHYFDVGNRTIEWEVLAAVVRWGNPVGHMVAWQYLHRHWDTMPIRFSVLSFLVRSFYTVYDYDKFVTFTKMHPPTEFWQQTLYERYLATINHNVRWRHQNVADIYEWIQRDRTVFLYK